MGSFVYLKILLIHVFDTLSEQKLIPIYDSTYRGIYFSQKKYPLPSRDTFAYVKQMSI